MSRVKFISRMHDVRTPETLDKALLLLAFLVGVFGGLAIKLLHVHPFVAAAFAAVVLVLYATLTFFTTHLQLEPEVIGDNCYYLGFLFTLTSLSITLYFVVQAGMAERAALIPEVISGFGIALSSTIVGVFLRVLMMQFRVDIVSRERETRLELDDAARRLRAELNGAIARMKDFTVESVQQASEREAKLRDATRIVVDEMSREIQSSAMNISKFSEEAAQLTAQREAKLRSETDALLTDLRLELVEGTKSVQREIETTLRAQGAAIATEMSASVQRSTQGSEEGIKAAISSILATVKTLETANADAAAQFGDIVMGLTRHASTLAQETERLATRIVSSGEVSAQAVSGITSKIVDASAAMESALQNAQTVILNSGATFETATNRVVVAAGGALEKAAVEIEGAGTEFGKSVARAGSAVDGAAVTLTTSLSRCAKAVDDAATLVAAGE